MWSWKERIERSEKREGKRNLLARRAFNNYVRQHLCVLKAGGKNQNQLVDWIQPFNSRKKEPYCKLSNFYTCTVKLADGWVFPSSEHAYQYLAKTHPDEDARRWLVGGKFSNWDYVRGVIDEHNQRQKLKSKQLKLGKSWKETQIGILAKFVINHPTVFKVNTKFDRHKQTFNFWKPILLAKFQQHNDLKTVLLGTGNKVLLEFSRAGERDVYDKYFQVEHPHVKRTERRDIWKTQLNKQQRIQINEKYKFKVSPWKGLYSKEDKYIYGGNLMGHFLMKIREILKTVF